MEEEPETMLSPPSSASSSSSQSPVPSADRPSTSSSSENASTSSEVQEEEEEDNIVDEESEPMDALIHRRSIFSHRSYFSPQRWWRRQPRPVDPPMEEETNSLFIREDTWSCIVVILTFWFFVSLTLILGIYGSETIEISPYSSILLQPNPLFVQYVKVEKSDGRKSAAILYGINKTPTLNDSKTWSESMNVSMDAKSIKEWAFFLNKGSELKISYNVRKSSSLMLVIAQGEEEMAEWLEDPSYPGTTLSWNVIDGSGIIKQDISKSSYYYVAVGNLNMENVKVQLKIHVKSSTYDTTGAYYKCSVARGLCSLEVLFPKGNSAILTSPELQVGKQTEKLYVELSYEPRWITYFVGIGGMTALMLLGFNFLSKFQNEDENRNRTQAMGLESERDPLLIPKDEDLSSLGSSYDSDPNSDEENLEDLEARLFEGKAVEDGRNSNITARQLCVICFDAPRDCFFLPCGHSAACFECATRIGEAAGTCPICRRTMKKIRKIFSV